MIVEVEGLTSLVTRIYCTLCCFRGEITLIMERNLPLKSLERLLYFVLVSEVESH